MEPQTERIHDADDLVARIEALEQWRRSVTVVTLDLHAGEAVEQRNARRTSLLATRTRQADELAQLELDAHDKRLDGTQAERQVHHGPAGVNEGLRIDDLRRSIASLDHQLSTLES
jgi:hypothetical protein